MPAPPTDGSDNAVPGSCWHHRRCRVTSCSVGWAGMGLLALLIAQPVATTQWQHTALQAFAAFYQGGALVFGDGHVVLPLLQTADQSAASGNKE